MREKERRKGVHDSLNLGSDIVILCLCEHDFGRSSLLNFWHEILSVSLTVWLEERRTGGSDSQSGLTLSQPLVMMIMMGVTRERVAAAVKKWP